MSSECFSRQTLRDLLNQWASGEITDEQLAGMSEELWNKYGVWQSWPREDKRSITFGALNRMRLRDAEPITKSDVPFLLAFLDAAYGDETSAWRGWDEHFGQRAAASS